MQNILFFILFHILYITLQAYFYTIQLVCSVIIRIWFFLRSMDIFLRSMIDCVNDLVDRNKEKIIIFFGFTALCFTNCEWRCRTDCFWFISQKANWTFHGANAQCKEQDGVLASVASLKEFEFLKNAFLGFQ